MKKTIAIALITAFAAALPIIAATPREIFNKKLSLCSKYSYVYKTFSGKQLKRTINGTYPIPTGLGCFYVQELSDGKELTCSFPIPQMSKVSSAFRSGNEVELLNKYLEDGVCEIK